MFGLENCVDFLSSAVVLWRFFAPSEVTERLEVKLKTREQRASIAISMVLVVLGLGIWIAAIEDLLRGQEDKGQQKTALAISFFSFLFFSILTIFKFHYADALDSPSLYKDGICSMIGTILSLSLFVDTLIIKGTPAAWWIDPVVAIGCGIASFVYGVRTLYVAQTKDKLPIFSLQWWFLRHGEDGGEKSAVSATEMTIVADDDEEEAQSYFV